MYKSTDAKMKILINLFLFTFCLTAASQNNLQNSILFNSSSDTLIILPVPANSFTINTDCINTCKVEVIHIRENKLISSMVSLLPDSKYTYTIQPETKDIFIVQLISMQTDRVIQSKRFHIVNMYSDNLRKSVLDSINHCNESIDMPYKYTFNVFINDKKTRDYEVTFYKTFTTTKTAEYSFTTIYSDPIPVKRDSNDFYLSDKIDSVAVWIKIGKSGKFVYEITDINIRYGATFYFAVSTNDRKLNKKYKEMIHSKKYSELAQMPYMSIAKHYSDNARYSKKHSVMYISCNEKCNPTILTYDFEREYYRLKNLK